MQIIENKKPSTTTSSLHSSYMEKHIVRLRKQSNMSKTEQNVLMTTILHIVRRKKGQTCQNWLNFFFTDMDDKMINRSHSYMNITIGS